MSINLALLIPSTNTTAEPEYHSIAPEGVNVQTGRMLVTNVAISDDAKYYDLHRQMIDACEPTATMLSVAKMDAACFGMAASSFIGGPSANAETRQRLSDIMRAPVTTAPDAFLAALELLRIDKIAVMSPYQPEIQTETVDYFRASGIDVVHSHSFLPESTVGIAKVTAPAMYEALIDPRLAECEAILQIGTNLTLGRIANAASAMLGKPILNVNRTMLWHALESLSADGGNPLARISLH